MKISLLPLERLLPRELIDNNDAGYWQQISDGGYEGI
jgi:hypothetical protein